MKFKTFYSEKYLSYARHVLKKRTVIEYERLYTQCLDKAFGSTAIDAINLASVESFHQKLSRKGKVQANRAVAVLSAILSYAVKHKAIDFNPCSAVKRNREKSKERFLSPEECKRLLLACDLLDDEEGAAFVKLILFTGARPAELLSAKAADITGDMLRIHDGKTGDRTIYLSTSAQREAAFIPFRKGLNYQRVWVKIRTMAELPGVRLYDLRHTFASSALASGADIGVIGQLLGHRKLQTTLRYAHLAKDKAVDAAQRASDHMMG